MACHPSGVTVDSVGTNPSNNGRSCECHKACGSLLALDVVVRFRVVQVERVGDKEQPEATAIAVHHVTGGVDGCHVGFLCRHLLCHKDECDALVQTIDVFADKSESPSDRERFTEMKTTAVLCSLRLNIMIQLLNPQKN